MSSHELTSATRRASNPVIRLLDTVGNIWFGVALLILIFLYSSIGSAVPLIRQGAMADWFGLEFLRFEKSEMEWFSWWPFLALIALFCLSIIVVTIRRIPLTIVNAGVWAIHTGIVVMCVACVYYFGTKVEGDTVIFQSLARIRVADGPETTMVIRPEAMTVAGQGAKQYQIKVSRIEPDFVPQSGPRKGRRTQRIWFNVTTTDSSRRFTRTMLVGDPSGTTDIDASTGERTLDTDLQIVLDYDPVKYFYHAHELPVRSNGAIYVRLSPRDEWTQLRLDWLPHYYEHVAHRDELWPTPGEPLPEIRGLDEPALKPAGVPWLDEIEVRVTDYLPYGQLESRYIEGTEDDPFNPVIRFRLGDQVQELVALDPRRRQLPLMQGTGFNLEFAWASSKEERARLLRQPDPRIKVRVESAGVERELKISALQGAGPVTVEGTDYQIVLTKLVDAGQLDVHGPAMAVVHVIKGEESFDRVVIADDSSGGRDLDRLATGDVADPNIKLEYLEPSPTGLILVAGPDPQAREIDALLVSRNGGFEHHQARIGEPLHVFPAVPLTIESLLTRARLETRPMILPRAQRQSLRGEGKRPSLVRVEINDGRRIQSTWLPFNEYPFPDEQRAQPRRFAYQPGMVRLADGRLLHLMYSRQREPLASRVALDQFVLKTYPGGDRESDFISRVVFEKPGGGWEGPVEIRSNQPAQHGEYWYFQSRWDPNVECHTVLGVGNRNGVYPMLAGVCISIAGMIYAFYIKPAIIRRRKQAAVAAAAARGALAVGPSGNGDHMKPADEPETTQVR